MSFGTTEIVVVSIILLAIFGGKKIPEFIKGLTAGIKEFRSASKEEVKEEV